MAFIQIIDFHSDRMDEATKHLDEYIEKTEGKRTTLKSYVCQDRDEPGHYLNIVLFDSYESAMENSALPETQEIAQRLAELATDEPTFLNLDVELERS